MLSVRDTYALNGSLSYNAPYSGRYDSMKNALRLIDLIDTQMQGTYSPNPFSKL